ncbi:hypothetical protein AB840_05970 [Megasphaera cerevisiae DSM 20462]|uniref:Uncharacterized protein n=1 Tax=Megasphaera cerevisiae DSM 20462 TaxID=1122219 RepID=A0A0J6WXA6_9FIRM|nr:hypothetical protein [Megasphaera cerevisiae]KMO86863.1 hypothetical protein AB840_05970 [Megasphaera cerevisiae DSM 20462]SJZ83853.1 hypothetical protein SAMN05660900_01586 [Megasphaera cerevisiae DSM 20462]
MYTSLILYRNELKSKNIPKYKLIGIFVELLFSKMIFPKNKDINDFLCDILHVEFKPYVMKSRTLIVAKVSKIITMQESEQQYKKDLYKFIEVKIEEMNNDQNQQNRKDSLDGWIR